MRILTSAVVATLVSGALLAVSPAALLAISLVTGGAMFGVGATLQIQQWAS